MKYNFNKRVNRSDTFSTKWNIEKNQLPMWIADMDFETPKEIKKAIVKRAKKGSYGYDDVSVEWKQSIIDWWKSNHDLEINENELLFSTGVIPTISSTVRRLSKEGDNIVVFTPVYDIFFHSIENNKRHVLECPMDYKNGVYSLNFDLFESLLKTPNTPLLIICNPFNPIGMIWDKETLNKIGVLCEKYHVNVISDEIHCDITRVGKSYTPFVNANEINKEFTVTCISPTKTFNLAGLQTSAVFIKNPKLFKVVKDAINFDEVAEPNVFAQIGAISAFNYGKNWLNELKRYLDENIKYVEKFITEKELPIKLVDCEATYLLWLDVSELTNNSDELCEFIEKETGLILSSGSKYRGNGNCFIRMNIACPRSILMDGLNRFYVALKKFKENINVI